MVFESIDEAAKKYDEFVKTEEKGAKIEYNFK